MLQIAGDAEKYTTLTDIQISIAEDEVEISDEHTHPLFIQSETTISENEIVVLKEHPWILLQLCTMHFYDFIYGKGSMEADIVETMFCLENEVEDIWLLIKKLSRKSLFFRTMIVPENTRVYKIELTGISGFGETVLAKLDNQGEIPAMWKMLYLSNSYPLPEDEGIYCFTNSPAVQENSRVDAMDRLLKNPFFRWMDISTIPLTHCEEMEGIQKILKKSSRAVVFVEEDESNYFKRIFWKYR